MPEKTAHKRVPRSQKDAGNGFLVTNSFQKKQNSIKNVAKKPTEK